MKKAPRSNFHSSAFTSDFTKNRRAGVRLRLWALVVCAALLLTGWPSRGYAQTLVANVPTPQFPWFSAVNPVTNKLYVASRSQDVVLVFDGAHQHCPRIAASPSRVGA